MYAGTRLYVPQRTPLAASIEYNVGLLHSDLLLSLFRYIASSLIQNRTIARCVPVTLGIGCHIIHQFSRPIQQLLSLDLHVTAAAMRLKIRSPAGGSVIDLPDDATISALYEEIRRQTSLTGDLEIKYSFPPKPLSPVLNRHAEGTLLSSLPVKLQGEQLIVSGAGGATTTTSLKGTGAGVVKVGGASAAAERGRGGGTSGGVYAPLPQQQQQSSTPFSFTSGTAAAASAESSKPLNLTRAAPKWNKDDPPDVRLPGGRGTMVLRVMEDDNSCLFRALSYVMTRSMMSVTELRQLVAGTIQENTTEYSAAVLEQSPDAYCEWIKMESSWGGGIELGILAEFFGMEVSRRVLF
jgi:ubiquitin thioesterase OTU1